jgi:hypothetical protein
MQSEQAQRTHDLTSRMREISVSGSVGAPEEQSSGATRQLTSPSVAALLRDHAANASRCAVVAIEKVTLKSRAHELLAIDSRLAGPAYAG